MIRHPPRSTLDRSSAASDVYKRQDEEEPLEDDDENGEREDEPDGRPEDESGVRRRRACAGFGRFIVPIPVSYTHLRAHATVLDLVCRLLLEKKKRHQTKNNKKQKTNLQ